MKKTLIISFILCLNLVFSQGEANIWYFGQNAALDFSSGSPLVLNDGQLYTFEGCAVMSTSSGQLLFYTDGITVFNRNHQVIPITRIYHHNHSADLQSVPTKYFFCKVKM